MAAARILLVEDDPNLGFVLEEALEARGFSVVRCADGEAGLAAFRREAFALCLLDVMLPRMDGFTLARRIRETGSDTPIVFLTAKSLREDRVRGFKLGGDDYITKPFSMEELALRIQAILRRSGAPGTEPGGAATFALGSRRFDYENRLLEGGGEDLRLTDIEAELLLLFCRSMNRLLDRDAALQAIWGETGYFASRSMDVYVSRLRKYLREEPGVRIVNVRGKGFKLVVRNGPGATGSGPSSSSA